MQEIVKTEEKGLHCDNGKHFTIQEFSRLTEDNFAVRLAHAKLATEVVITNFLKERDFDNKIKSINKRVTLKKTKHVLIENGLDVLLDKVKLISTKGLT